MAPFSPLAAVASAFALGVLIPWLAMRMLVPSLRSSEKASVTNFRGRPVFYGLGVVWLVWAGCAIATGLTGAAWGLSVVIILPILGMLALAGFAFGLVDDAYGTSADRGFRGHITAMLRGRLTTGGLKLVGIGAASMAAGLWSAQVAPWSLPVPRFAEVVLQTLVVGASVALTANLINLTDLRPGRALKSYAVLAMSGAASAAFLLGVRLNGGLGLGPVSRLSGFAVLTLFALGPVFATWRYDLGEQGMAGDAGANAMGCVAGLLIVAGLPAWGVVAYFVAMLALNLASEKVSFSRVIEQTSWLAAIDRWGRLPDDGQGAKSSPDSETNPE